ncbi:MAG TPA: hypothetical protein DDZ96_14750 [Porphyromonadaceae bacterium]|nr:hypothetical protein [Porphyromonadaceae bacterium]HBX21757.1 hypothetical protein [Porphyromonadaceae bacterium]HCM20745.1 hypothetical protein [Porphyromonadaceae bacterium]
MLTKAKVRKASIRYSRQGNYLKKKLIIYTLLHMQATLFTFIHSIFIAGAVSSDTRDAFNNLL